MKKREVKDLFSKEVSELEKNLAQLKKDAAKLIIERRSKKNKNISLIGEKKKDIARILTVIRQKEIKTS